MLRVRNNGGQKNTNTEPQTDPSINPSQEEVGNNLQPQDMPPTDDMNQVGDEGIPQDNQEQSEYDTNFDAGVEADEDTDPKKYIQQLTGKLSTTLGSYNTDNGEDDGLNKYVAKMILKQAVKNMTDSAKKDLIKAINTTDTEEDINIGEQ